MSSISTRLESRRPRPDTPLDLSRTTRRACPVIDAAVTCRVIATRCDDTAWGGSIAVTGDGIPFAVPVSIADPGTNVLRAEAKLGIDQLDGCRELVVEPGTATAGEVDLEFLFEIQV